jgi:hypothetical protein
MAPTDTHFLTQASLPSPLLVPPAGLNPNRSTRCLLVRAAIELRGVAPFHHPHLLHTSIPDSRGLCTEIGLG